MDNAELEILPLLLSLLVIFSASFVSAHGTSLRVMENGNAVVVAFSYSDGDPMSYAGVLVYSPENNQVEYQNGRTDLNGHFAFYPNIHGLWRIEASDGLGHKETGQIEVHEAKPDGRSFMPNIIDEEKGSRLSSQSAKVVAGISLIGNICLGLLLWKRNTGS